MKSNNRCRGIKRVTALGTAFLLAAMPVLSGCGSDADMGSLIAFVGNINSGENQEQNTELWQGVTQFADESGRKAVSYEPESSSVTSAELAIKQAIDDGADVVVCTGDVMEHAIYEVQQIEKHTQFLLLDGVPTENAENGEERIRGNTYSVIFSREIAGFLAGYAAVKEGCRVLGFYGGSKNDEIVRYGSGFIQGANQAAGELKLRSDEVVIQYKYMTSNAINPAQVAGIADWFTEGCQVIAVAGRGAELVAEQGAVRGNGKIITDDMSTTSGSVIMTEAGINYANAAVQALTLMEDGSLKGGETNELGLAESCMYLNMEGSSFTNFTESDYEAILAKLQNGEITVTSEDVTKQSGSEEESSKKGKNSVEINNVTLEEKV